MRSCANRASANLAKGHEQERKTKRVKDHHALGRLQMGWEVRALTPWVCSARDTL